MEGAQPVRGGGDVQLGMDTGVRVRLVWEERSPTEGCSCPPAPGRGTASQTRSGRQGDSGDRRDWHMGTVAAPGYQALSDARPCLQGAEPQGAG